MKTNRHLYLVSHAVEKNNEGPITRLGLWYRFQDVPKARFTIFVISKIVLLGVLFYVVYGK